MLKLKSSFLQDKQHLSLVITSLSFSHQYHHCLHRHLAMSQSDDVIREYLRARSCNLGYVASSFACTQQRGQCTARVGRATPLPWQPPGRTAHLQAMKTFRDTFQEDNTATMATHRKITLLHGNLQEDNIAAVTIL